MIELLYKCYRLWGKIMAYGLHLFYAKWCRDIMKQQSFRNLKINGEKEYIKKWKPLYSIVNKRYYRIFSHYIDPDPNIVPEDICHNIIEHVLNPVRYRPYYSDKNVFDKLFPDGYLPKTILRCINGFVYSSDYQQFNSKLEVLNDSYEKLFLKPTKNSSSGRGILLFERCVDGTYHEHFSHEVLTMDMLKQYRSDWILQEGMEQSETMKMYNPTSINTLRLATYRSVVDNQVHVTSCVMRIGKNGSVVDNAHAGGLFVGVTLDGTVGHFLCDQFGNRYEEFNGLDFKNNTFVIPDFERILKFSVSVAEHVPHLRLLAQDVMIDSENNPRLLEFNSDSFSSWLFQFTVSTAFGDYTDEIIEYCSKHKHEIERVKVSVW